MQKQTICLIVLLWIMSPFSEEENASKIRSSTPSEAGLGKVDRQYAVDKFGIEIPSGVLYGKFSKEDGPFLITGSVIVPAGQVLEFGPGCNVYVGGKYSTITIFGSLTANGTDEEPVLFRSAYKEPNPWDWDRLYIRSRTRSNLRNFIIKHSNYGIHVQNGAVTMENCKFVHNSLHGMVIDNSDAVLNKCTFSNGHVLALYCREGASLFADSLVVQNNITGLACTDQAYVNIYKGSISYNRNGVVSRDGASVSIVAADVKVNKIGLITEKQVPRDMAAMVYNNIIDIKSADEKELDALLKQPQGVRTVVLPSNKEQVRFSRDFKAGFSATPEPRGINSSFIGNVELGMGYYKPESHRRNDTLVRQSRYPEGIQPEMTVFLQGKRGEADINLNADIYHNEWVDTETRLRKDLFSFALTYGNQTFQAGDFYEHGSETSVYGRKLTGIKYTGNFFKMGRGENRLVFDLAAGESEVPKDSGDHEPLIYNQVVDTGFSVRQQLTYLASLTYKPTYNSHLKLSGIIARDQTNKTLLGRSIFDPLAPAPTESQTGCIEANIVLFEGALSVTAELDMGVRDTVDSQDYDDVAWYNPGFRKVLPRVFGQIHPDSNGYAAVLSSQGIYKGYHLFGSFSSIGANYFSAGNPYLENDRYILRTGVEKRLLERLNLSAAYAYERSGASSSLKRDQRTPVDENKWSVGGEYSFGNGKPLVSTNYTLLFQRNDQLVLVDFQNEAVRVLRKNRTSVHDLAAGVKQRLSNGLDYHLKYRFAGENDLTDYTLDSLEDLGDSWYHEVSGGLGLRIGRILQNKAGFAIKHKKENQDSLRSFYFKVSDNLRFWVVPGKLNVTLKGYFQKRIDDEFDLQTGWFDKMYYMRGLDGELKYSITARIAALIKGVYEKAYDENPGSENFTLNAGGIYMTYLF